MKVLAIIPAREGSKGIKDKNVAACNGRPLIAWTIDAARKASEITRVIVSTDSTRYRDILEHDYGKELFPFIRPEKYAKDESPSSDVIIHALDKLAEQGEEYDIVVLLEPTSPLRTPEQINEAIQLLKQAQKTRAIVSVVSDDSHVPPLAFDMQKNNHLLPYGLYRKTKHGDPAYPGHPRRQAIHPAHYMSGDFYLSYVDTYRERLSFDHELTEGYLAEPWQSLEIDHMWEFIAIEALMKARQMGKV